MPLGDRAKILKTLQVLLKQRAELLRRLKDIRENLRRVPAGSRARHELLEAKASIREALRLNAIAIRILRSIL